MLLMLEKKYNYNIKHNIQHLIKRYFTQKIQPQEKGTDSGYIPSLAISNLIDVIVNIKE